MDMLIALYFRVLRVRPEQPDWDDRDRFVLSKGHSAVALYTVLALRGYLPIDELATFDKGDSRLQGHPDMTRLPGVEASTGSLGQGLSFGMGVALAARRLGRSFQTFVMLGDGEIQEGMVWEAAHAARRHGLANLTAILDYNGLQQYGWPRGTDGGGKGDRRDPWDGFDPAAMFAAFGWNPVEVDGHDIDAFIGACEDARTAADGRRPTAIVAHTRKGRGLSFTEGNYLWHARVPDDDELERARVELGIDEGGLPR
jgi:transketolase